MVSRNIKLPSIEEQRRIRNDSDFYEADIIDQELREIVSEICLKSKSKKVQTGKVIIESISSFIMGLTSAKFMSNTQFPFEFPLARNQVPNFSMNFRPPTESPQAIGGFPLRISFKKNLIIDISCPILGF